MGTWKLNEAKSKSPAGGAKNSTVIYSAEGKKTKVVVEGTAADGKAYRATWVGMFDGKAYPIKGYPLADAFAYKMANDRTLDITGMKAGKMVFSGTIKVSADGKSRVVETTLVGADGKKVKSKNVYDRA